MKRFLSLLLAIAMLTAMLPQISISAFAAEETPVTDSESTSATDTTVPQETPSQHSEGVSPAAELTVDEPLTYTVTGDGEVLTMLFTPAESGLYSFTTESELDTIGTLYTGSSSPISENDDSGEGNNFLITAYLQKDTAYTLDVSFYSNEAGTVTVSASAISAGTLTLDSSLQAVIEQSEAHAYFYFTAEDSGTYLFTSDSDSDTYATLYNDQMSMLASDDDHGSGSNFLVSYEMTAGETCILAARFLGSQTGSFNVSVSTSPIAGIEAKPLSFIRQTHGSVCSDWNSETGSQVEYYRYDWWNYLSYTVTFSDGSSQEVCGSGFEHDGVYYELSYSNSQHTGNVWTVGNTYDVSFSLLGMEAQTTVTITESPVVSMQVEPISLFEGICGYYTTDYIPDTAGYSEKYFRFSWQDSLSYTATLSDGTTVTGDQSGYYYNGEHYSLSADSDDQSYQNVWTAGNTYRPTITVLGYAAEVPVTVTKAPVTGVEVTPVTMTEIDAFLSSGWDSETGTWVDFTVYEWWNKVSYTVTFTDGSTVTATGSLFDYQSYLCSAGCTDDQGPRNQWTAGNTYTATLRVMDMSVAVPVTISASPVQSVSVSPVSLQENIGGSYYTENGVEYYRYYWWNYMNYTVTFTDGSTQTGSGDWIDYNGNRYWFTLNDTQSSKNPWTAGNTYTVPVSLMGCDAEVCVTVAESPIVRIDFEPLSIIENSCGYWATYSTADGDNGTYYHYQWWPELRYTVTFSDGSTMAATGNYFNYNGETYSFSWSDGQGYETPWAAGNTYTITVSTAGCSTDVTVTITESPIDSIVFDPITIPAGTGGLAMNVDGNGSYYWYHWWEKLSYTVTFSDGSTQSFTGTAFSHNGADYTVSYTDTQQEPGYSWSTGTYTLTLSTAGVEAPLQVTITEPTAEELGLPALTTDATQEAVISEAGQWIYFAFTPAESGNYTFSSQTSSDTYGYLFDSSYHLLSQNDDGGENTNFSITSYLDANATYLLAVKYLSSYNTGSFPVSVTKALGITSVTVDPITIPECSSGYVSQGPTGSWFFYHWSEKLSYTVCFDDGSTATATGLSFTHNGASYTVNSTSDNQSFDTPWLLGGTYSASMTILGYEAPVSVTITESPIASVVMDPLSIFTETNGYYTERWDEDTQSYVQMYYYHWWNSLSYTVTFNDGSTVQAYGSGFTYNGESYSLAYSDTQYSTPWEQGNTYSPTVTLGKHTVQAAVTITESPIQSIVFQPIQVLKESGGNWVNYGSDMQYYQYYWWNNLSHTVTFKDGSSYTGTGNSFCYNNVWYGFSWSDTQSSATPWLVGNTYSVTLNAMGVFAQASVTVIDSISGYLGDNLTWTLTGDGTLTISGTGAIEDFNGSHEQPWGSYRSSIRQVVIGSGVTSIGRWTFYSHDNLTSVTLSDTVTTIGEGAFVYCGSLTNVTFSDSVISIGSNAFRSCVNLTSLVLGSNVTTIGDYAFAYCTNLTEVTIPYTAETIGYSAFYPCSDLANVYYTGTLNRWNMIQIGDSNSPLYTATLHCTGTATEAAAGDCGENVTWSLDSDGVLTVSGTGAMADYTSVEELPWYDYLTQIRAVIIESGVTTIGSYAFYSCSNLLTVTVPETVSMVGSYSFYGCELVTSVMLPDTLTEIGDYAFFCCTALLEVYVGPSLERIGSFAFSGCDNLCEVYYSAPGMQWGEVLILGGNEVLYDVYLYTVEAEGVLKSGVCGDDLIWVLDDSYTLTVSGTGAMADFFYSSAPWAAYVNDIYTLVIEEGVTYIGQGAFSGGCNNLTSVTIPGTVTEIGCGAFAGCTALSVIVIPEGVQNICDEAFAECSALYDITLPESLQGIGFDVFANCYALTGITIPANVSGIGHSAFSGCNSLARITVDEANAWYCTDENGVLFSKDMTQLIRVPCALAGAYTVPSGVVDIYVDAFSGCWAITSVTVPDSVTNISPYAFRNCTALTEVSLGNGITALGEGVFANTGLVSVTIPEGVTAINHGAFQDCGSLTQVVIPETVTYIGDYAFAWCTGLTQITIPAGVTYMGQSVFEGCENLEIIEIPEEVTEIGSYAFADCLALTTVTMGSSVTAIGEYAFFGCDNLTSVTVGENVETIGEGAFEACANLTDVTIPEGVTSFVYRMFAGCASLETIEIPTSVQSIDNQTFAQCTGLTEITVPDSVLSIGDLAFNECHSLTSVTLGSGVESIGSNLFSECMSLTGIWVSEDNQSFSSDEYGVFFNKDKTALYRCPTGFTGDYVIPETVEEISYGAFSGCDGLTAVTIPGSMVAVGPECFYGCASLESVTIGEGVTHIGSYAFAYCSALSTLSLPDSLTYIGEEAFSHCYGLTDLTIPANTQTISYYAFSWCENLTNLTIPVSVTLIEPWAFVCCDNLQDVYYTGTTAQWNEISISYGNESLLNADLHCTDTVELTGITVSTLPDTTAYTVGQSLDLTGMVVSAIYSDGSQLQLMDGYTVEGFDSETVGTKTLTVTYEGFTAEFTVTVTEAPVVILTQPADQQGPVSSTVQFSVEATGVAAYRWQFRRSETGSWSNTSMTGYATDTLSVEVTEARDGYQYRCKLTGNDGSTVYTDAATLSVYVAAPELERIEIAALPEKLTYLVGETADTTGLVLNAIYSDGSVVEITEGYTVDADLSAVGTQYITVTYEGCTASYSVQVEEPVVLDRIEIATLPEKLTYLVGETADTTGLVLNAIYSDGSVVEITEGYTVDADLSAVGTQYVTVTYEGCTASYSVQVQEPVVLDRIEIAALPEKLTYLVGETADTTGLVLNAIYSDGSVVEITEGYTVEADLSAVGTQYITVTYESCSASFSVTVQDPTHYSYCEHCAMEVQWTDWTAEENSVVESGHYRLTQDVSVAKQYRIGTTTDTGKDVVLDLNGLTLSSSQRAFIIYTGSSLSVIDSVGGGQIVGGASAMTGGTVMVSTDGILNLFSGTISSSSTGNGGCVYVTKGSFNMYGGSLVGATLASGKLGGAVYAVNGNFSMYGGEILDGVASSGNSVYVGASSTALFDGGSVGEVMVVSSANVTVSGAPVIGNLDLSGGALIDLGNLCAGANITVTANGVFTNPSRNAQMYAVYFTSADADAMIVVGDNTLSVAYPEEEPELIDLIITAYPDKTEYALGETLDITGLVLTGYYSDGTEAEITEGYEIEGYDPMTPGLQTVTVTCGDFQVTFEITVMDPQVTGIEIAQLPEKLVYTVSETLDTTGLVLLATYSNGSTAEITEGFTVDGFDPNTPGEQTLTVTYEGITTYFKVNVLPQQATITKQPESQTVGYKETAQFTVEATGVASYQWQYRRNAESSWQSTKLTGYNTAALTVTMITSRNGYQYRCVVTCEDGTVLYSDPATLTMDAKVEITGAPSDTAALEGSFAPFTVEATDVLSYRWYYRRNAEDSWHTTTMKGYVTNTLQVLVTPNRDGYQYRCKITGLDGTVTYTEPATLTVTPVILSQPTSQAAQIGETAIFRVETQNVTQYQWLYRRNSESSWANTGMSGNKTAALSVPMTAARAGYQYMCRLTNSDGTVLYTNEVTLYLAPQITQQPADVTVAVGNNAVFTVEATDVVSYQWQFSRDGITWSNTTADGNKTATLSVTTKASNNGYMYRCKITGVEGYILYTDAVTLTVE